MGLEACKALKFLKTTKTLFSIPGEKNARFLNAWNLFGTARDRACKPTRQRRDPLVRAVPENGAHNSTRSSREFLLGSTWRGGRRDAVPTTPRGINRQRVFARKPSYSAPNSERSSASSARMRAIRGTTMERRDQSHADSGPERQRPSQRVEEQAEELGWRMTRYRPVGDEPVPRLDGDEPAEPVAEDDDWPQTADIQLAAKVTTPSHLRPSPSIVQKFNRSVQAGK